MVDGAFTEEREREKIGAGGDTLILNMVNLWWPGDIQLEQEM